MTTAVEHTEHAHATHDGEHSWTDRKYVMVAIYLAIMTGIEVGLSYMHPSFAPWLPTVLLCLIMVIKFVTVVLFFMHLRFDDRMFGLLFWSGLILAIGVFSAMATTLQIWSK